MTSRAAALPALLAGAFALAPVAALAGPPYVTDDPEPVDHRHLELYVASQGGHDTGRNLAFTAPHVEVNYGAVPDLQLHLIAPMQYARPAGGTAAYGLGNLELGAKYRFSTKAPSFHRSGRSRSSSCPRATARAALGAGQVQAFLPLWLQKGIGPVLMYGGGGWRRQPRSASE